MSLWGELLVLQAMIGYCFVIANTSIGLYNIRDLNNMKGDIIFVRFHKWFGRVEAILLYAIAAQCITMAIMMNAWSNSSVWGVNNVGGLHNVIGGILATGLFTIKFVIAVWKKNTIYRYGQYIGPLGAIAWSLAFWTSVVTFYTYNTGNVIGFVPSSMIWAAILPFPIGIAMFLGVLAAHGRTGSENRFSIHQIAFILHGITFGYEKTARDLLGSPALFQYVIPKTYAFLTKLMDVMGLEIAKLQGMNVTDAMEEFMKKAAQIGMAEKIVIHWEDSNHFTVESVNCSTAKVRSAMSKDELENAICPWAIMAATIVNKITNKDLEIEPSEFNEIGAKSRLTIKEE